MPTIYFVTRMNLNLCFFRSVSAPLSLSLSFLCTHAHALLLSLSLSLRKRERVSERERYLCVYKSVRVCVWGGMGRQRKREESCTLIDVCINVIVRHNHKCVFKTRWWHALFQLHSFDEHFWVCFIIDHRKDCSSLSVFPEKQLLFSINKKKNCALSTK